MNENLAKHYKQLKGKTVKQIIHDNDFWGLEFTDGTVAWIVTDAEINGPGFLDIIPPIKIGRNKK